MTIANPEPWANVRAASTTSDPYRAKIGRPRRAKSASRRQATPLKGLRRYGISCPVSVTLTIRRGSSLWVEVANHEGRFFIGEDSSVMALIEQVQRGGHWVDTSWTADRARINET